MIRPEELLDEKRSLDFLKGAKRIRVVIMMEEYAKRYHEYQVKKCDLADVGGNEVAGHDCYKNRWEVRSDGKRYCVKCGTKQT